MFEQSRTDHNVPKAVHLKPVINTIRGRLQPLMPALFEDSLKVFFSLQNQPPLHQSAGLVSILPPVSSTAMATAAALSRRDHYANGTSA